MIASVVAAIPSPPGNAIELGPFALRAYGLLIALGVVAAVAIARRRWRESGGNAEDITALAVWAVPAGVLGARLYHVATDWHRFSGRWWSVPAVWEGGLGIPGGLLAGVVVGVMVARRRGLAVGALLDTVAPAIPVAQAIGRVGNWFNQELYGRPTDLPWALHVDPSHRPTGLGDIATFHPTFLYEATWNLALAALLVVLVRRWRHRPPGQLFVVYVTGYALGRLWIEALRIDPATLVVGVRINIWVSGLALLGGVAVLLVRTRRHRRLVAGRDRARSPGTVTGAGGFPS